MIAFYLQHVSRSVFSVKLSLLFELQKLWLSYYVFHRPYIFRFQKKNEDSESREPGNSDTDPESCAEDIGVCWPVNALSTFLHEQKTVFFVDAGGEIHDLQQNSYKFFKPKTNISGHWWLNYKSTIVSCLHRHYFSCILECRSWR